MHHFDELNELISNDSKLTWIEKAELTCFINMEQKEDDMDKVYLVYLEEDAGEYPAEHLHKICSSKEKAEEVVENITTADILEYVSFRNTDDFSVKPEEGDPAGNFKEWSIVDSRGWLNANITVWIDERKVE